MTRVLVRRSSLVAALLAAALVVGWWWSHPDVLDDTYGASMRLAPVPLEPDSVFTAALTDPGHFPDEGTLTVRSLDVRLARSPEERPAVEVLRCQEIRKPGGGRVAVGAINSLPPRDHECVPAEAGTVLGPEHQLVAVLRPGVAGTYRISDLTVGYRLDRAHLWRTGTETMRTNVTVVYRE